MYGMAADQVLSMEVVLPDGLFVTVSETSYPDLYWALRGGGGGTFGVVTSLVIRAYPKLPVTTLTYSFGTSTNITNTTFWEGMDAVWATFPSYADAGHYRYWSIACASESSCSFSMAPHWANNSTVTELQELVAPLFAELTALGVPPQDVAFVEYDGLLDAFTSTFPTDTEVVGTWTDHVGSRLFPRSNWENATALAAQSAAIRETVIEAGFMIGYNIKAGVNPSVNQTNAVNPAWRETLMHALLGAVWASNATAEEIAAPSQVLTERLQLWRDVSPGAGAYMNEADINEPDFQQSFYGSNYPRLYALKQQYDPWGLFYAVTAVGSEDWYITGQIPYYPTQNGRLCPVGSS
jgi:FAD/FMN-containing dehydrogenase